MKRGPVYTERNSADVICNLMSWALFMSKKYHKIEYEQQELNHILNFINPAIRNLFIANKFKKETTVDLNSLLYTCITTIYSNKDYSEFRNNLSDKIFNIYINENRLDIIAEEYNDTFNIKGNYIEDVNDRIKNKEILDELKKHA